ncbi:MAG: hypothetical protein ACMXYK_00810 [Candidatus Woesearchaeota archaeon]
MVLSVPNAYTSMSSTTNTSSVSNATFAKKGDCNCSFVISVPIVV